MEQLKMYWIKKPVKKLELPDGYSFSNYKDESDKLAWCECCKNGLVGDDATVESFDNSILSREGLNVFEDVFFLDYNGEHIATITAYVNSENNIGNVHMVGMRTDFRGKSLAKYLNNKALTHLYKKDIEYAYLTTDDWRKGAVKSYLNAGFLPVKYSHGMSKRWKALLNEFNIPSVQMLKENAQPYKIIYK
ncbi:MAG: GNAT family N-acetyltransferase [Ruminococcus sp.]|nr:GNAT family N-acetyltransferase [Candidatus Copronaster equi]